MHISEEVRNFAELYGSIRRYAGLMGNFAPDVQIGPREAQLLKQDILTYRQTIPIEMQKRMVVDPSSLEILERECDRIINENKKSISSKVVDQKDYTLKPWEYECMTHETGSDR